MTPREQTEEIQRRVNASVIGQERVVERLIIALLANGNVLVEGLPGLAKTRAIKSLSQALDSEFSRIQFTPDLLPSDVTGGEIYRDGKFEFRQWPVFGNLVLADEINRAPAKVQSALLEAMEERQVTVAGKRYRLPDLFMVLATQNPIEQEGTYPLPEAQMDRFLMHVRIDYPSDGDEAKVLRLAREDRAHGTPACDPRAADPHRPRSGAAAARADRPAHEAGRTSDPADLSNLRDIVVPPAVSFWPPAPGWWLVGAACAIAAGFTVAAAVRYRRRNAYRREALRALEMADGRDISAILKRAALAAFPREQVASLNGAAWLAFLDRTGGTAFAGTALLALTYGGSGDRGAVAAQARHWIERHRC